MIKVRKFIFNPFSENTYVLWDNETKESAVIDPGCYTESEESELENFINTESLNVKYLINTHCHIDHIFGCEFVKRKFSPQYLIPELDTPFLDNAGTQAKMFGIDFSFSVKPDDFLDESKSLFLHISELKFLFTPGHTKGEYCIYLPQENICITGDVLFYDSIGRTDLWGGDYETLINSINNKLLTLPDKTIIHPGHGDESTILREKKFNPFLQ